jgi:hypothetical protein
MALKQQFCNQDTINEAAEKSELPKFLLKKIEEHWHSFTLKTITSSTFENVSIPFFVKFEFNKRKMDAINLNIAHRKVKNK